MSTETIQGFAGESKTLSRSIRQGFDHALVVVEGIDGTGKSTYSHKLADYLGAVWTCEPTEGIYGEQFRDAAQRGDQEEALALSTADREKHAELITGLLSDGEDVVCDRYYTSCAVYQGQCDNSVLEILHDQMSRFRAPLLWVHVSTPPAVCLERVMERGEDDSLESLSALDSSYQHVFEALGEAGHTIEVVRGDEQPERTIPIVAARIRDLQGGSHMESRLRRLCATIASGGVTADNIMQLAAITHAMGVAPAVCANTEYLELRGRIRCISSIDTDDTGYSTILVEPEEVS